MGFLRTLTRYCFSSRRVQMHFFFDLPVCMIWLSHFTCSTTAVMWMRKRIPVCVRTYTGMHILQTCMYTCTHIHLYTDVIHIYILVYIMTPMPLPYTLQRDRLFSFHNCPDLWSAIASRKHPIETQCHTRTHTHTHRCRHKVFRIIWCADLLVKKKEREDGICMCACVCVCVRIWYINIELYAWSHLYVVTLCDPFCAYAMSFDRSFCFYIILFRRDMYEHVSVHVVHM